MMLWLALSMCAAPAAPRTNTAFVLPVAVDAAAMQAAKTYVSRKQVVVYFPDVAAEPFDQLFAEGPVTRARARRVEHGFVITLDPRDDAASLRQSLQKHTVPRVELAVPGALDSAVLRLDNADNDALPPPDDAVAVPPALRAPPSGLWPTQRAQGMAMPWTSCALTLCLALLGTMAWLWRQRPKQATGGASIEILAIRSLGPKHKLALIDTCGERLLISASDKGVSLLSHLQPPRTHDELDDEPAETEFSSMLRGADTNGLLAMRRSTQETHS